MTKGCAIHRVIAAILATLALSGCDIFGEEDPVQIAAIGPLITAPNPMNGPLSPPNAALLTATAQGLVSIDADGQTDIGLAERWTVTTDGRSYIFRIREAEWSDGKRVTARDVARLLTQYIAPNSRHPLRANFVDIESIRAMTDQVIEIRLKRPQSHLLELLAHPAMSLPLRGRGWGPLDARRGAGSIMLVPQPDPLAEDPDAARAAVEDPAGWVELRGVRAPVAIARFKEEAVDGIFGGRMQDFPYYVGSRIARNRLVVDPVPGLFGLAVVSDRGVLATERGRDAISMAIDRARVIGAFGLDEWAIQPSLRPSQNLRGPEAAPLYPAWIEQDMNERRAAAATRVRDYRSAPPLRIALPPGPGSRILFAWIAADLRAIGIAAERVDSTSAADLLLIDEVAPADDSIWAFRRLSCGARILCSREADAAIKAAEVTADPIDRARRIVDAELAMVRHAAWIPLATPLRWSVVSPRLTGGAREQPGRTPIESVACAPQLIGGGGDASLRQRMTTMPTPTEPPFDQLFAALRIDAADPQAARKRVETLEMLLERSISIPGFKRPIGLDAIVGLIPVVGDAISAAMGAYIIWEARNMGLPKWKIWRMVANLGIDTAIGAIPVAGDAFDLVFRSNTRNLRILKNHLDKHVSGSQVIEGTVIR